MTKEQLIELVRFTAGEISPTELSIEDAESIVDDFVEQLTIADVVATEGKCCGCEESTGETKLWCCNHCGKRVEDF